MRTSLVLLAISALATASPVSNNGSNPPAKHDDDKKYDCDKITFYNPDTTNGIVSASCPQDLHGEKVWITSTLDLNSCVANEKGQLTWRKDGNAFKSCENEYIADPNSEMPILAVRCGPDGERTAIRLSDRLYNYHGVLRCDV